MAKKPIDGGSPSMRGVMDSRAKETMLAVIVRNRDVFEQVRELLAVKDVRSISDSYAVVYKAVTGFFAEYGEMPEKPQLLDFVSQLVADSPGRLSDMEVASAVAFIDFCFDPAEWQKKDVSKSPFWAKYALKQFRRFRDELAAAELSATIHTGKKVAVDLAGSLRDYGEQLARNASIDAPRIKKIFGKGWRNQKRPMLRSTGLTAIDKFLGGGWRDPELVVFMGPYGSCKTVVGVQAMCTLAMQAQKLTQEDEDGCIHKVVLASYEMPLLELQERCLAFQARIPRDRLADFTDDLESSLRDGGDLLPYEKEEFAGNIKDKKIVPSEVQRADMAEELLNRHAIFLDMSNSDPDNPQGYGGVPELVGMLRAEQRRYKGKLKIHALIVDHLAAMTSNMMNTDTYSFDDATARRLIRVTPKKLIDEIGKPMKTPILLLHQMSGEANSRSPTAVFHHTDGDECKSVGMFADFAVVTGPPTKDSRRLCVWDCTKFRRQPPRNRMIISVVGRFNRVTDVSAHYVVDPGTRQIVSNSESGSFAASGGEMSGYSKKGGSKAATGLDYVHD